MWGAAATGLPQRLCGAARAPLLRAATSSAAAMASSAPSTCAAPRSQQQQQQQQRRQLSTSSSSSSSSSKMTPESRHFQDAKRVYEAEVRAIRQQYIAEVKQKFEEEQARQRAEQERIKEAKRKRLLAKAEERRKNLARFLEAQREQRERFSKYLVTMQKVREAYVSEYRAKQEHLLKALSEESALWITEENIDEKITDDLFAVAGRSTFLPTRRSRDWEHMALPRVPDFSAFAEEDLFDEKEDVHFLTEKSPWKGAAGLEAEGIPEGHEYYKPGPLDEEATAVADRAGVASDPNIYFEDAAFRPSWLDKLYQGAWDDFHPSQVPDHEVEHLRELAERYEEQLFAILAQKEGGGQGQGQGQGAKGAEGGFDPEAFADEMDALGGGPKKE